MFIEYQTGGQIEFEVMTEKTAIRRSANVLANIAATQADEEVPASQKPLPVPKPSYESWRQAQRESILGLRGK